MNKVLLIQTIVLLLCLSYCSCKKQKSKYSAEANQPPEPVEKYDPDFRAIQKPYRMAKLNMVWSKAVHVSVFECFYNYALWKVIVLYCLWHKRWSVSTLYLWKQNNFFSTSYYRAIPQHVLIFLHLLFAEVDRTKIEIIIRWAKDSRQRGIELETIRQPA